MNFEAQTFESAVTLSGLLIDRYPEQHFECVYKDRKWTFAAAPGRTGDTFSVPMGLEIQCIYGDTDSVFLFFRFGKTLDNDVKMSNKAHAFYLGEICAHQVTHIAINRAPIDLEFEKILEPLVLLGKKQYISKIYESPVKFKTNLMFDADYRDEYLAAVREKLVSWKASGYLGKVDRKGVATVRRNYCMFARNLSQKIEDTILTDSVELSIDHLEDEIETLLEHNINPQDLVVSNQLNSEYKARNKPHVAVYDNRTKLLPLGIDLGIGDRIPYIFVERAGQKYQKAEHPMWAQAHNLDYDRACYLDQIRNPIMKLYEGLGLDQKSSDRVKRIFVEAAKKILDETRENK